MFSSIVVANLLLENNLLRVRRRSRFSSSVGREFITLWNIQKEIIRMLYRTSAPHISLSKCLRLLPAALAFFLLTVLAIYFSGPTRAQISTKSEGRVSGGAQSKATERSTKSDDRISSPQSNAWVNNQNASVVLGEPNFTTNTGGAGLNQMNGPYGIAVDPATGKVFVADQNNDRVLRFASVAAMVNGGTAEAVFGGSGVTGGDTMSHPVDVTIDPSGNFPSGTLWVADSFNNRILKFGLRRR